MPLRKSVLLKDYLLDDLSSCSSNGFRSYPRRQCCTKVRYLIEIDLNKHIKLPSSQNQFLKSKSKAKSKPKYKSKLKLKLKSPSVLHKASAAVVNVFTNFHFSGSGKPRKANLLPRNLSRKLSKRGFWKRTTDQNNKEFKRLNSLDEPIKQRENVLIPARKGSAAVTTTTTETKTSVSNSNSSASSESYFTATSNSSTTGGSSKINVAQNEVEEIEQRAMEKINMAIGENAALATTTATATNTNGNVKKEQQNKEKDQFSPISVMDFPDDDNYNGDEDEEVTSPFQHSHIYFEGSKRKNNPKVQRTKNLAQLKSVRLEDRITLLEPKTHDPIVGSSVLIENQNEKKAIALLQLLKATMPSCDLSRSKIMESFLLGFFRQLVIEGNGSDYIILQEAKDWINNQTKDTLELGKNKLAYLRDMEKGAKWLTYDDEVGRRNIGLELEFEVFTSLVEEMFLDFYL